MRVEQIAAQLYTTRSFLSTSAEIASTLRKLRRIGYQAVELAGLGPIPDAELARLLRDEGITCCGTHEPEVLKATEKIVERLNTLSCRHAVLPSPAGFDLTRREEMERLITSLEKAGAELRDAGHVLAYHNHATEFMRLDGELLLDLIFNQTSPNNVQAEIDTFWVQFGGGDPGEWCARLSNRLPLIHLKDYAFTAAGQPAMTEVGAGNLNWRKIIAAAKSSGCEWFVVEHDEPSDPFQSLAKSFSYLQENCLAEIQEITRRDRE